jgi:leucine-rich PPR motif-containing protein, mitochondrial
VSELEAHLVQLEVNNLNSRGVLRKLFQKYCQHGDVEKANTILEKCKQKQIRMSDGMKASAVSLYLKCNDLAEAEKYLTDLQKNNPKFDLDEHKIIDYANLLVKNEQLAKAFDVLKAKASAGKPRGGNNIVTNCWNLLTSIGAHYGPEKVEESLHLLSKLGFCKYSNILLGPQVRVHLNR